MRTVDPVKHAKKREELLRAAKRCFVRRGLAGASIADICAEAGISPGHLYHYFESKEAILAASARWVLEDSAARLDETDTDAGALARFLADEERAKERQGGGHLFFIDLLAEACRNPAVAAVLQEHTRTLQGLLAGFLRKGQGRGDFDPALDPSAAASLLIAVMDGYRLATVRDPALDRAAMLAGFRALVARLLGPKRPSPAKARGDRPRRPRRRA